MIVIDVKDANDEIVLRSRFRPEAHGTPRERAMKLLGEVFDADEIFEDRRPNLVFTEYDETAIWYEM